jgi:predicted ribosomally synthesized peptide with nif11-like leader
VSIETVKKFLQKTRQDHELRARVTAIHERERESASAAVVRLAAESGFAFTVQEYDSAVQEELAGEMSDEALEMVSGGRITNVRTNASGIGGGSASGSSPTQGG